MKAVLGSLIVDFKVIAKLLRESWKSVINSGEESSVDEAIFDFFSQTDLSSPQRFMLRKPHPHSLLCYHAAFKTELGPFIFDLEPDHDVNALSSRHSLERIRASWALIVPTRSLMQDFPVKRPCQPWEISMSSLLPR